MKKYLKKSLALFLALVCAMNLAVVSFAEETVTSGQCGENVTWEFDETTGTLTISGEGEMMNYENCGSPWYSDVKVKSVVFEKGITSIGDDMLRGCSGLTSVTISDSVTSIGNYAFGWCDSLKNIIIPNSVTKIGIGAFNYCYSLEDITFPNSLISIGEYAFESCDSFTSVTIPDSVTSIGHTAFSGCSNITDVTIGKSVTNIGFYAFKNCDSLTSITVNEANTTYSNNENGILFNKDKTEIIDYPDGKKETIYAISYGVTSIGDFAFADCDNLITITIPDSITIIGKSAFNNCDNLKDVVIPDSVISIEEAAFRECYSFTSVVIPDSVTAIENYAFYYCTNLSTTYYTGTEEQWDEITIGSNNDALTKNIVFNYGKPSNMCGENATWSFDAASGTLTISGTGAIDSDVESWKDIKAEVVYVEIADGITAIDENAFRGFTALKEVYLAESVTTIGSGAFADCDKLSIVTLLADNTSFPDDAFTNTDSRLFFVVKSGSQSHSAVAGAGYTVTPFSVGTEEIMDNRKVLTFEGRSVFYGSLDYNYISNLMFFVPDLYYIKFEKLVMDGVTPMDDFIIDLEIPEVNLEDDEEYLALKDVYLSVVVDGSKVSFAELRERIANGDYSGFIFTDYKEDGENSTFIQSVAEFFGQITEGVEDAVEFVVAAFNAVINTVTKFLKKLFK